MENLRLRAGQTIVDGTLGGGGHAEEILRRILPGGKLIGVDKDEEAIQRCRIRLNTACGEAWYLHGDFKELPLLLEQTGIRAVDGYCSTSACLPFSWRTPQEVSHTASPPRWICAWTNNHPSRLRTWSTDTPKRNSRGSSGSTERKKWASRIADFIEKARARNGSGQQRN